MVYSLEKISFQKRKGIKSIFLKPFLCTYCWGIYLAVVVLNVEDEEKEAQYSIYIPVVGSAPYLETGHTKNTTCVFIFIVNFTFSVSVWLI